MINDIVAKPPGSITNLALIVAPYFDIWFASEIAKAIQPRRMLFLVDDGASTEEVEALRLAVKQAGVGDVKIALGQATGLMHLKAYYLEFSHADGSGVSRQLHFGSANATRAAFSGKINAELLASTSLEVEDHAPLVDYFTKLAAAVNAQSGTVVHLKALVPPVSARLRLPTLRVKPTRAPTSFDAWIQRGRLAAKYRGSSRFLTVAAPLREAFRGDAVQQAFALQDLIASGERSEVRFRYIAVETPDGPAESERLWRSKYCIWTHFGEWLSDECFEEKKSELVAGAKAAREAAVNTLLQHDEPFRSQRKEEFLARLQSAWVALERVGDPTQYIEHQGGRLDKDSYGARFDEKFAEDVRLAHEPLFRERFISGYEFSPVPKFRSDLAGWQAFIRSWCESISVEMDKRTTRSMLSNSLAGVFPEEVHDPAHLHSALLQNWQYDQLKEGSVVYARYEDGYFYAATVVEINPRQVAIVWKEDGQRYTVAAAEIVPIARYLREYHSD